MKIRFLFAILFLTIFSIMISENAYGSLSLDKGGYSWTDKVKVRLMVHGFDHKQDTIQISVGDHELKSYKLSKAGNGLYTGEVILTGFSHDVDGDGRPDTNPRTTGSGPNNGFLESMRDESLEVSVRLQDGTKMKTTTKIAWNVGEIAFDMSNHQLNETAKLQAIDPDMNLNPETLDKLPIHVFSDSDKAGILVDAIETEEESGIFETTISFTQSSGSSGNRLFAISGDTIYAQYNDHTLPKPYDIHANLEIVAESTVYDSLIPEPEPPYFENIDKEKPCGLGTLYQDGICVVDKIENSTETSTDPSKRWGGPTLNYVKSPLKQFKSGFSFSEIKCNGNLQLTQRYDDSPACVKSETVFELIKRGWVSNMIIAVQSRDVFLDPQDATSSYMEKVIPTLDDFKNTLSEPYSIDTIFSKFGEPHDDIGSGIHIYVYELNDSTEIWIGYTDHIWYVKHVDLDGNVLEELL
ncbi:MAG: hypothetical protein ACW9W4_08000 [Candidatus Nitrosopumilus sp. bin_7KS]